jgi:hypothetical protein
MLTAIIIVARVSHVLSFENPPFPFRNPLHTPACENACASSPTFVLRFFSLENQRVLFPENTRASCVRDFMVIFSRRTTTVAAESALAFPDQPSW